MKEQTPLDVQTDGWFMITEWSALRLLARMKTQTRRVEKVPRYLPGDLLYLRESHWRDSRDPRIAIYAATPEWHVYASPAPVAKVAGVPYRSDNRLLDGTVPTRKECREAVTTNKFWKQHPGMLMPRWASRLFIRVMAIRTERVQRISGEDAVREGFGLVANTREEAILCFQKGWDEMHFKKGHGWAANPLVTVYTFKVLDDWSQRMTVQRAMAA